VDGLAPAALALALARGLSVYDAASVALAEASDAILVTADRVLAAATPGAVLIR
jgi:predicted nucleic acid-binding protein